MFLCHIEPSREDGGTPSAKLKFKSTSELAVAKPFSDAPNLPWNRTQCKQASQPSYTSFRKQTAQYEFRPAARRDSVAARLYVDAELQMKRRLRLHVSLQAVPHCCLLDRRTLTGMPCSWSCLPRSDTSLPGMWYTRGCARPVRICQHCNSLV